MSFYKETEKIIEYLNSIRKLEAYFSFDVVFPKTWSILKNQIDETKTVFQKNDDNGKLISFLSEIDELSITNTIQIIEKIVVYNKEKEEKQRLFDEKVKELKQLFEKEPLDELKNLKFDVYETEQLEGTGESVS